MAAALQNTVRDRPVKQTSSETKQDSADASLTDASVASGVVLSCYDLCPAPVVTQAPPFWTVPAGP